MKRIWKIFKWTAAGIGALIILLVVILVLFTGPIAKYIIEHNSEKFTGRIIRIDKLKINVFNGKINAYGLKVYEQDKKTLFFGFKHMLLDIDKWKLMKQVYRVEHLLVEEPYVRIAQKGSSSNYDDILKKFEPDPKKPKDPADTIPVKYLLDDLKITGGKVSYNNEDYQLNTQLMKLGIMIPKFSWNDPSVEVIYNCIIRTGGLFTGDLRLNLNTLEFTHNFKVDGFKMDVLYPYLTPYLKIREFRGQLNLDLKTKGNFNDPMSIAIKGKSGIYKLELIDDEGKKVAGFNMFTQTIDSLNFKQNIWKFGPILMDEPYFRYEKFPDADNLSRLVLASMTTVPAAGNAAAPAVAKTASFNPFVMGADYISAVGKEIVITDYRVRRFSITGGMADYYDHTLDEEFHLHLSELYFDVEQLNSEKNRAMIDFSTTINKGGFVRADISVNPNDLMEFDVRYEMKNVAVVDYNPYSVFNVAYPFTKGKVNYTGTVSVKNHKIKMDNKLFVEKIYAGKKVKNKTSMNLPVKLVLAILRDKNGNITLVVPVEGDLDNPKFKWWKIVGQVLKNLFTKAVSAPASLLASSHGGNEEDYKEIKFEYGQQHLTEKQMSHLGKLTEMLKDKPELVMELKQTLDPDKDLEYLTYNEAKKRFYAETMNKQFSGDTIPREDFLAISTLSITDSAFVAYLNKKTLITNPLVSTLEKCTRMIGAENLKRLQKSKMDWRNEALGEYIKTKLSLPANRFVISNNTDPAQVPEDNIPRYLISYSVPE
ncbi:MAG: DUF748 domain-containing protein [Bacteroidetes bacterium]|nr:DUF748 domain-containing protein [Bacteroidota bacterium]